MTPSLTHQLMLVIVIAAMRYVASYFSFVADICNFTYKIRTQRNLVDLGLQNYMYQRGSHFMYAMRFTVK